MAAGLRRVLGLAAGGLGPCWPWPPAPPSMLPPPVRPKAIVIPQCLSQGSVVLLLSQDLPQLLQNIKLFSHLSEASFVQLEPDGLTVPCTGFT